MIYDMLQETGEHDFGEHIDCHREKGMSHLLPVFICQIHEKTTKNICRKFHRNFLSLLNYFLKSAMWNSFVNVF